ncbi:MAG: hypothetical protein Q8L78_00630 [Coxiellaceae bacterium]|nr:hypothetical protein [Coxiellaceae bacterium]
MKFANHLPFLLNKKTLLLAAFAGLGVCVYYRTPQQLQPISFEEDSAESTKEARNTNSDNGSVSASLDNNPLQALEETEVFVVGEVATKSQPHLTEENLRLHEKELAEKQVETTRAEATTTVLPNVRTQLAAQQAPSSQHTSMEFDIVSREKTPKAAGSSVREGSLVAQPAMFKAAKALPEKKPFSYFNPLTW